MPLPHYQQYSCRSRLRALVARRRVCLGQGCLGDLLVCTRRATTETCTIITTAPPGDHPKRSPFHTITPLAITHPDVPLVLTFHILYCAQLSSTKSALAFLPARMASEGLSTKAQRDRVELQSFPYAENDLTRLYAHKAPPPPAGPTSLVLTVPGSAARHHKTQHRACHSPDSSESSTRSIRTEVSRTKTTSIERNGATSSRNSWTSGGPESALTCSRPCACSCHL